MSKIHVVTPPGPRTAEVYKVFDKLELPLVVSDRPIVRGAGLETIFQLDIRRNIRGSHRDENFLSFYGDPANQVAAPFVSEKRHQFILRVVEDAKEFEEFVPKRLYESTPDHRKKGVPVIKVTERGYTVLRRTNASINQFLLGKDETSLFMARLPTQGAISKIEDAWESLKPAVIKDADRRGIRYKRQGEYFMLDISGEDRQRLDYLVKKQIVVVRQKMSLNEAVGARSGGNLHTADEVIFFETGYGAVIKPEAAPLLERYKSAVRNVMTRSFRSSERVVFIKGNLRHVDHYTDNYPNWVLVVINNEPGTLARGTERIAWGGWID